MQLEHQSRGIQALADTSKPKEENRCSSINGKLDPFRKVKKPVNESRKKRIPGAPDPAFIQGAEGKIGVEGLGLTY